MCLACIVHVRFALPIFCRGHVGRGGGGYAGAVHTHLDIHNKLTRTASAHFILNQQFHECDAPKGAEISAAIAAMF